MFDFCRVGFVTLQIASKYRHTTNKGWSIAVYILALPLAKQRNWWLKRLIGSLIINSIFWSYLCVPLNQYWGSSWPRTQDTVTNNYHHGNKTTTPTRQFSTKKYLTSQNQLYKNRRSNKKTPVAKTPSRRKHTRLQW